MRPTLRQLQYLVAISETGRFGEAARRLHVSQPSLSAQIAEMEDFLGVALVERGRSGAMMTPLGQEFVSRARIILRDVESLKALARQGKKDLVGRIHLGVLPSIGPYLLPQAVKNLHANHPDLRLAVSEERTIDLGTGLKDGRLDTIISTPEDHPDAEGLTLFREALWICAAMDDPLMEVEGPVSPGELAGRPFLTLGHGHRLSQVTETLALEAGSQVSTEYEGTSLDAIRQMALMGAGVAILPSLYALQEARRDPDLRVRRIDHPLAQREVGLYWRPQSPLGERFSTLASALKTAAEDVLS